MIRKTPLFGAVFYVSTLYGRVALARRGISSVILKGASLARGYSSVVRAAGS